MREALRAQELQLAASSRPQQWQSARLRKKYASQKPPIAIGTTMSAEVSEKVVEKFGSMIQTQSRSA